MPKALPLHHPTAGELQNAHAIYIEHEPTAYAYRLTQYLLAGDAFSGGEAIHALMRIWTPKGPQGTPAGIAQVLEATADARGTFAGRPIASLDDNDHASIADIYTAFRTEVGAVGAAKALSVLHPRFFPIWDTKVAIAYIGWKWRNDHAPPAHYLTFMAYAREQCISAVNEAEYGETLLKTLDEWNYAVWRKGWIDAPATP